MEVRRWWCTITRVETLDLYTFTLYSSHVRHGLRYFDIVWNGICRELKRTILYYSINVMKTCLIFVVQQGLHHIAFDVALKMHFFAREFNLDIHVYIF